MSEIEKNDKLLNNPKRWILEIDKAKKRQERFIKEGEHIEDVYRGEITIEEAWDGHGAPYKTNTFNILFSNTKILEPAVFSRIPKPICKPRFVSSKADDNSVEAAAAKVMQRALTQSLEQYDFKAEVKAAVKDALLPGDAQIFVSYDAVIENKKVKYEYAKCEFKNFKDVLYGHGKKWSEIPWVAFREYMDRAELEEKFGAKGKKCPLNKKADVKDRVYEQEHILDMAEVYKIYDKQSGMVMFICEAMPEEFLLKEPQQVKFKNKLPVPKPLRFIESNGCFLPVPLYRMYATQAKQLEKVSRRILMLTEVMKVRGAYDGRISEMRKIFEAGDNDMIPVENGAHFSENGFDRAIWMMPLDQIAAALVELKKQERSIIEIIYEITGISDIMRGNSDAMETAKAQQIKSNFGTLPLQEMQERVQEFIAEVIRLKAEVIAENFSIETLQQMTGLEYPTEADKQFTRSVAALVDQTQNPGLFAYHGIDPEKVDDILSNPTWEQIKTVLESDILRTLSIDIETDSTLREELVDDKRDITELLGGVMDFIERAAPAVNAGILPMEAAKALLMSGVRRYKLGTEVEDALSKIGEQKQEQQPQQPDPQLEVEQLKTKQLQQKRKFEIEKIEMQMQQDQAQHEQEMAQIQARSQAEVQKQEAQLQDKLISGVN